MLPRPYVALIESASLFRGWCTLFCWITYSFKFRIFDTCHVNASGCLEFSTSSTICNEVIVSNMLLLWLRIDVGPQSPTVDFKLKFPRTVSKRAAAGLRTLFKTHTVSSVVQGKVAFFNYMKQSAREIMNIIKDRSDSFLLPSFYSFDNH